MSGINTVRTAITAVLNTEAGTEVSALPSTNQPFLSKEDCFYSVRKFLAKKAKARKEKKAAIDAALAKKALMAKKAEAKKAEAKAIEKAFAEFEQKHEAGLSSSELAGLPVSTQKAWLGFDFSIPTLTERAYL